MLEGEAQLSAASNLNFEFGGLYSRSEVVALLVGRGCLGRYACDGFWGRSPTTNIVQCVGEEFVVGLFTLGRGDGVFSSFVREQKERWLADMG